MSLPANPKSDTDRILVWDLPLRIFHWMFAGAFTAAYVLSESERLRNLHVALGWTVLALLAFRLAWGFAGSPWARFRSFAFGPRKVIAYLRDLAAGRAARHIGHNPAGSWVILAMLALAALTGISGWCNYEGVGGEAMEELHELAASAWLALVVFHVTGVIVSSFMHRENLVSAMVTGYKRGHEAEAGNSPRRLTARAGEDRRTDAHPAGRG